MTLSTKMISSLRRRLYSQRYAILSIIPKLHTRYSFSRNVFYCMDRTGHPIFSFESSNPHHHLIISNSEMTLRFDDQNKSRSNDNRLRFTGEVQMVDPGDHDALERYVRYFDDVDIENHTRGKTRLYRFLPAKAELLHPGRDHELVPLAKLIQKNPFPQKQEDSIVRHTNEEHHDAIAKISAAANQVDASARMIGLDSEGFDIAVSGRIVRVHFQDRMMSTE